MRAINLYSRLENDFNLENCKDDWSWMEFNEYVTENFKKRYIGVVLNNTEKINRIYTAVFPSEKVLETVFEKSEKNVLLVTHHPMVWDIRNSPNVFSNISRENLEKLKERKVSLYTLHSPLDNLGTYSTTNTLVERLGLEVEREFFEYFDHKIGLICSTSNKKVQELNDHFSTVLGHKTKLWAYGNELIKDQLVSIIPGGGNDIDILKEVQKEGVNTHLTGVTVLNEHTKDAHTFAKKNGINLLGGTHYSTEKFACISLCEYFRTLGLKCEFIKDKPIFEDLE